MLYAAWLVEFNQTQASAAYTTWFLLEITLYLEWSATSTSNINEAEGVLESSLRKGNKLGPRYHMFL